MICLIKQCNLVVVQRKKEKKIEENKRKNREEGRMEQRNEGRKKGNKEKEMRKKKRPTFCGYSSAHLLKSNQAFKHRAVNKSSDQARTKSQM